jgi:hypothetical protein
MFACVVDVVNVSQSVSSPSRIYSRLVNARSDQSVGLIGVTVGIDIPLTAWQSRGIIEHRYM